MKNKLLTITMPVYNGWPYIKFSIDSILHQSYEDFFLLIIDDGSTDYTQEYINSISDSRVRIVNKHHSGIIDSFNLGLNMTETKYIARVDADDYYFPNKFQRQLEYLEMQKDVVLVGTNAFYMSENNFITKYKISVPDSHEKIIEDLFEKKRGIIQSTIVMRTHTLKKIKGYRPNIYPEDYDLYFRIGQEGKFNNIMKALTGVRIHKSYSHKNLRKLLDNREELRKTYLHNYNSQQLKIRESKLKNSSIYKIQEGIYYYINGHKLKGLFYLFSGLLFNPSRLFDYLLKSHLTKIN